MAQPSKNKPSWSDKFKVLFVEIASTVVFVVIVIHVTAEEVNIHWHSIAALFG